MDDGLLISGVGICIGVVGTFLNDCLLLIVGSALILIGYGLHQARLS